MSTQKIAPIIITVPGPLPYTSDKAVPWHYGADVYVLGVKQEFDTSTGVSNITGPAKITRSGRLFSPDIAPPAIHKPLIITPASVHVPLPNQVPVSIPAAESPDARGKGIATDLPALTEAPKTTAVEASQQEMEEILKIIKKSDFNVVEQLGHTPSKISMLSLLLCS